MYRFHGLCLIPVPLMTALPFLLEVAGPPIIAGPEPRLGAGLSGVDGLRTGEKTTLPRDRSIFLAAASSFTAAEDLFKTGG